MIFVRYRKDALRTLEVARLKAGVETQLRWNGTSTSRTLTVEDFGIASNVLRESGITEPALKKQVVRELDDPSEGFTETDADALATVGIDLDEVRSRVEQTFVRSRSIRRLPVPLEHQ